MAGQIKHLIDQIIEKKSRGSDLIKLTMKTKFVLKGIDPDLFTDLSPDDPEVLDKIKEAAKDFNVDIDIQ